MELHRNKFCWRGCNLDWLGKYNVLKYITYILFHCLGDSGAPLTLTVNGRFILIAIVSNGYGCGLQNYPGLYTPVYTKENIDWIKKTAFKRNFHGI
ncbi:Serine protease 44 [Armadillidium vulgare]|nr:Serine protease 44 [Armadillidium vulgare]